MIYIIVIINLMVFAGDSPVTGAIRWDAWTGGAVTKQVERSLGQEKYHHRLPWFSKVIGKNKVRVDGSPQRVMDKEIMFASDAGLDYWAFLLYPKSSRMSMALNQYLKSSKRDKINFSLILRSTLNVSDEKWPEERDRAVALLKEAGYQTVLNGRPLVYCFKGKYFHFKRFIEFRKSTHQAGLNPYFVFMGWNPVNDFKIVSTQGFDAVSAYAKSSKKETYKGFIREVEKDWEKASNGSVPYVPLVSTGWDNRPRQERPAKWQHIKSQKNFPSLPSGKEIASHLNNAIKFVKSNPKSCASKAIILYAWNEHSEGGWLSPTRKKNGHIDTSRLDAIKKVLTSY